MKSIIQEASSIAKAIEQAWISAGQPLEFNVKILEEPHKNFLGFTTRAAKVAFFFDLSPTAKTTAPVRAKTYPPKAIPPKAQATPEPVGPKPKPAQFAKREYKPQWNTTMVKYVHEWIQGILDIMHLPQVTFTVEPSHFYLRIVFSQPLMADSAKEKKLFASLAHLIIESLKRSFKTSLKGHKIVLLHTVSHAQPR